MFIVTHNLFLEENETTKMLNLAFLYVSEFKLHQDILDKGYTYTKHWLNFFKKKKQLNIYKDGNKVGSVYYIKERIPR